MKNKAILRRTLFLGTVLGGIMTSFASEVDCTTKVEPTFCAMLNQASADSDTFSVTILFFHPAKDTSEYCRNLGPRQDTNGQCVLKGYDSAYYAKLKSDADTMYTKFELWDAKNPTVRLMPPDSGKLGHMGVVATKSTIIAILEETYVQGVEAWKDFGPIHIISRAYPRIHGMRNQGKAFLPNGRIISTKTPFVGRISIR